MNINETNRKKNTWCVYKHTSPSGKVYIGITHHKNPKYRFGKNGNGYRKNIVFKRAIDKYGWNNFKHEILYENLSEEDAKNKEKELIQYYKELDLSYNMTIGGDGHNFGKNSNTPEYHTELSKKYRKEHPDWDKNQYIRHCEKKKEAARNYYYKNREKILEYKKSEKVKEKNRLRVAWWRKEHPDYMKNYMKEYNKKIKEKK